MDEAAEWAEFNPRLNGYCVAYELTAPPNKDHVVRSYIQEHWKR
jgi:hypothetical protein